MFEIIYKLQVRERLRVALERNTQLEDELVSIRDEMQQYKLGNGSAPQGDGPTQDTPRENGQPASNDHAHTNGTNNKVGHSCIIRLLFYTFIIL